MSWDSRARTIETAVLLGPTGEDITAAVRGAISIERSTDSTVATGSLPLLHPKLAYYHPQSWALGPQDVSILVRCRPGGSGTWGDWVRLFRGVGELPENHGHWQTRGVLRLVSHAYRWSNEPLCVMTTAFPGITRGELIQQAIDVAGLGITVSGSWPSGRLLCRPQDFNGQNITQMLARFCELEGGGYRETDAGLELFDLADCWGPAVTPLWDLTRYIAPAEVPPQKPVTHWIFSGTEPKLPDDGTVTTELPDDPGDPTGPRTVLTQTVTNGAITQEIEERYALYAPRGVTPGSEEVRLVKRVTTDNTHVLNGDGKPTGRLTQKVTTTEEWKAPLAATGTGDPNYTWSDGTFSTEDAETFRETKKITEDYVWNSQTCALENKVIETKEWAAPLSEVAFTDPEVTWSADSSTRIQDAEIYEVRKREKTYEGLWSPGDTWDPILSSYFGLGASGGRVRYLFEGSERCAANYANAQARRDYQAATAWMESPDGLSHQKWPRTWPAEASPQIPVNLGEEAGLAGIPPKEGREDVPEPMPNPPFESGTAPLYALRPWVTAFTVDTRHPVNVAPPVELVDAETVDEAKRAGRYRARQQFAPSYPLTVRGNPERKPWDPIRFSNAARYCSLRQGWVRKQQFALDPLTASFREALEIAADPFPSVAP